MLYGGQSAEHDVSRVTAAHVLKAIDTTRYRVTPIAISTTGEWLLADGVAAALASGPEALPGSLDVAGQPVSLAQATLPSTVAAPSGDLSAAGEVPDQRAGELTVVLPLLHGPLGEDGTVQGMLELTNVAYIGAGVLGSALAMDKAMAKVVLAQQGIAQARHRTLHDADELDDAAIDALVAELGLPCFVKPANMGSSVGVSKAHDRSELLAAIALAHSYDEWVVVEEAIIGREIEVAVLGSPGSRTFPPTASVPGEIVPGEEFYSYDDKYVTDGAQLAVPADLTAEQAAEVKALAVEVFTTLRADGLARVDFFLHPERGFLCNEINTMPGFTPISMFPRLWQASGVSYPELIDRLVDLAIERAGRRRRNVNR